MNIKQTTMDIFVFVWMRYRKNDAQIGIEEKYLLIWLGCDIILEGRNVSQRV